MFVNSITTIVLVICQMSLLEIRSNIYSTLNEKNLLFDLATWLDQLVALIELTTVLGICRLVLSEQRVCYPTIGCSKQKRDVIDAVSLVQLTEKHVVPWEFSISLGYTASFSILWQKMSAFKLSSLRMPLCTLICRTHWLIKRQIVFVSRWMCVLWDGVGGCE